MLSYFSRIKYRIKCTFDLHSFSVIPFQGHISQHTPPSFFPSLPLPFPAWGCPWADANFSGTDCTALVKGAGNPRARWGRRTQGKGMWLSQPARQPSSSNCCSHSLFLFLCLILFAAVSSIGILNCGQSFSRTLLLFSSLLLNLFFMHISEI